MNIQSITSRGLAAAIIAVSAQSAIAQSDPLSTGRVLEFSYGSEMVLNTLQDQLTTPNNFGAGPFPAGPTTQSTRTLDVGSGEHFALSYSQDLFGSSRAFVEISHSETSGGGLADARGLGDTTFPGSWDDGNLISNSNVVAIELLDRQTLLTAGAEVASNAGFTFSTGFQVAYLEHESQLERSPIQRSALIETSNRMYGFFGRAMHYTSLGHGGGLRVTGTIGVLENSFDYYYLNTAGASVTQEISTSGIDTVFSVGLTARYEHSLTERTMLTAEIGYDGFYGVVNGFDTFLDRLGTDTVAHIDRDHIGSTHVSLGLVHRF